MQTVQVLKWELLGSGGFGCWIEELGIVCQGREKAGNFKNADCTSFEFFFCSPSSSISITVKHLNFQTPKKLLYLS